MAIYHYVAVTAQGVRQKGQHDADSERAVIGWLKSQGLFAVNVSRVKAASMAPLQTSGAIGGIRDSSFVEESVAASSKGPFLYGLNRLMKQVGTTTFPTLKSWRPAISTKQLALTTRQLASLLQAGLTLEQSLLLLARQASSPKQKHLWQAVLADIVEGQSFSQALDKHPREFGSVWRAGMSAGEHSGQLAAVCSRLADHLETRSRLSAKITAALVYPSLVSLVAVLVVLALMTTVVPQVIEVFRSTRQELPLMTRVLIFMSDGIRSVGVPALVVLLCGFLLGVRWWRKHPQHPRRLALERWALKFPLFGTLWLSANSSRFASSLALMVSSGVSLLPALQVGRNTLNSNQLKKDLDEAIARVREGASLAQSLAVSGRFPLLLVQLIASGERSGQLTLMLEHASRIEEADLDRKATLLTTLLEPMLVVLMGGVVLFIVMAVLLPMRC